MNVYYSIGMSHITTCFNFIWITGSLIVSESLDKTSYSKTTLKSCKFVAVVNGKSKMAVSDGKCIVIIENKGLHHEIMLNTNLIGVNGLFYSRNSKLVVVGEEGLEIFSKDLQLVVSISNFQEIIKVDFDKREECLIIISEKIIQKYEFKGSHQSFGNNHKNFTVLNTLQLDSVVSNSRFVGGFWSRSGSNSIHAVSNTGILMVIKDNLWVDRTVDVKMNTVNCILGLGNFVIVGGSFTR